MALIIHRDSKADLSLLRGMGVSVIGYGNQGRAHALNLRDSDVLVTVGQRPGKSFDHAVADGWSPKAVREAVASAELIILTLPDESAAEVYAGEIAPVMRRGCVLGFVHGFNIRFGFIQPPAEIDVIMVAPKGPGRLLRSLYVEGKGLPALMAVHQNPSGRAAEVALSWAAAIGCTRAAVVETTFAAETETDLFGEQAVLCGGVSALCKAAFDVLVEAGYEPEFAYLECVHELKQIADLIYELGLSGMRDRISGTARYGDVTRGPRIVEEETKMRMRTILEEIRGGAFAKEWIEEHRSGGHNFRRLRDAQGSTNLERAGKSVRALMPWVTEEKK